MKLLCVAAAFFGLVLGLELEAVFDQRGVLGTFKAYPNGLVVIDIAHGLLPGGLHEYHIHEHSVGRGDCASAGGIFDPEGAGGSAVGSAVGDLSAKWGRLRGTAEGTVLKSFVDGRVAAHFKALAGRSVVIHDVAGHRWVCADIKARALGDE